MNKKAIVQQEIDRRTEKAENNNFIGRNHTINIIMMWVIYPIAALFSALTQGSHLYVNFEQSFSNSSIALFITVLIAGVVELGKFVLTKEAIEDIISNVFSQGGAERRAFILKLIGALIFNGFSVYLSVSGAPTVAEHIKTNSKPIALVSVDSINQAYDLQIASQDSTIEVGKGMTWKGKVVSDGRDLINSAMGMKATIEGQRSTSLSLANEENERRREKYQASIDRSGFWFTNLTGLGELICMICLFFWGNYEAGVDTLVNKTQSSPPPSQPQSQIQQQTTAVDLDTLVQKIIDRLPQQGRGQSYDFQNREYMGFNQKKDTPDGSGNLDLESRSKVLDNNLEETQTLKTKESKPDLDSDLERDLDYEEKIRIIPVSKLEKDCRNHWTASNKAAVESTRNRNKSKYIAEKNQLEEYGYTVNEISETSLQIIPPA